MSNKPPCKWVLADPALVACQHPLVAHLGVDPWAIVLNGNENALCHGCPCHEPEPAKDTTQKGDGDAVATD